MVALSPGWGSGRALRAEPAESNTTPSSPAPSPTTATHSLQGPLPATPPKTVWDGRAIAPFGPEAEQLPADWPGGPRQMGQIGAQWNLGLGSLLHPYLAQPH